MSGLAIARHFVERGAQVMFADMDEARLMAELGDQAREEEGSIRFFSGDLRQKLAIANLISATYDAFGRVDILVNTARQFAASDPLVPEADQVEPLWQANVLTALRLSQQVARRMIDQAERDGAAPGDAGAIVNLTSIAAGRGRAELMGFSMACGAIEQMTRALALALAPHRIRVNALSIGSVMTSSLQGALRAAPERRDEMVALTPLRRIAGSRETVETVQFLASEASAFMTGQVITLDGGRSLLDPAAGALH